MHAAATVLLLRGAGRDIEVLMMRRGAGLSFMAGMWVFPGGRLDDADQSPAARSRVLPTAQEGGATELHGIHGERLPSETALGLRVAACREAFEEAGLLLARTPQGEPCDSRRVDRLQHRRPEVVADASAFVRMLEEEDLYLDLGPLVYWSHWITPSLEPKRFDTRFFVVPVPPGQSVSADQSELTEYAWVNPSTVATAIERGDLRVVPPTLLTLEDLAESHARHGGLYEMLRAESGRPTPPVMPRIDVGAGQVRVVMPWDPGYEIVPGEGCGTGNPFPPHFTRLPSSLAVSIRREAGQKNEGPGR